MFELPKDWRTKQFARTKEGAEIRAFLGAKEIVDSSDEAGGRIHDRERRSSSWDTTIRPRSKEEISAGLISGELRATLQNKGYNSKDPEVAAYFAKYAEELASALDRRSTVSGYVPGMELSERAFGELDEHVPSRRYTPKALERGLSAVLAAIGFLGTYLFLSPKLSGYVVSTGTSTMSYSLTGILMFFLGIIGLWIYKNTK